MTIYLLYAPVLIAIAWILLLELRDHRRDREFYGGFLPPPSREVRVQTLADAFQEDDPSVSWEHAYALAVLAVDVLELVEAEQ